MVSKIIVIGSLIILGTGLLVHNQNKEVDDEINTPEKNKITFELNDITNDESNTINPKEKPINQNPNYNDNSKINENYETLTQTELEKKINEIRINSEPESTNTNTQTNQDNSFENINPQEFTKTHSANTQFSVD